jgi:hypothetical protein
MAPFSLRRWINFIVVVETLFPFSSDVSAQVSVWGHKFFRVTGKILKSPAAVK